MTCGIWWNFVIYGEKDRRRGKGKVERKRKSDSEANEKETDGRGDGGKMGRRSHPNVGMS
jgi:hypothetical protein